MKVEHMLVDGDRGAVVTPERALRDAKLRVDLVPLSLVSGGHINEGVLGVRAHGHIA